MLIKYFARKVFKALPAEAVLMVILERERKKRSSKIRKCVKTIHVQTQLEIDVYYKTVEKLGAGPAISIIVRDIEILRFDFFGKTGHYHILIGNNWNHDTGRIAFASLRNHDQVQEAILMIKNLQEYINLNQMRRVRNFRVSQGDLEISLKELESILSQHLKL